MNGLRTFRDFFGHHPQISAFAGLALAMVVVVMLASKDVGLEPGQRFTLAASTVLLAGLCVWIINWDDEPRKET